MNLYIKHITLCLLLLLAVASAPAQKSIDQKAMAELVNACKASHSAGLAIWWNGKPYKSYTFDSTDRKVPSFSAHKSVISLAVGKLITDGKLKSIDTAVHSFYPEWKQGLKKTITIRHLLNHTSGIEYIPTDPDGWDRPDIIKYALSASVVDTPGSSFNYNDKAVDLLRGVIEKIAGERMDTYIGRTLFQSMDIRGYTWEYDKAGTPQNLLIEPAEFVKLGQLLLNKGSWNGRPLVSAAWIEESLAQGQPYVPNCGLLWWRIPEKISYVVDDELLGEFKAAGVGDDLIEKFRRLKGSYDNVNIPPEKLQAVLGADWKTVLDKELYPHYPRRARWKMSDKYIGYKAEGWRGQYIIIYPGKNLVACRMVRESASYNPQTDEFRDFENWVYKLVR